MTKLAYKNEEGKLVLLNTANDECLYSGHWIHGRENNRFDELYVHKTKSGKLIFYIAYVTFWQGESNSIDVLEDVQLWLEDHFAQLQGDELDRLAELGYKVEETA